VPRRPTSSAREGDGDKRRGHTFAAVEAIGRLVEDDPATYYLKKHYLNHPCVLVRLTRIRLDALRDVVVGAHRFVNVQMRSKSDGSSR
jgi:hypothetical protein